MHRRFRTRPFGHVLALAVVLGSSASGAQEILLFDDFDKPELDTSIWDLATWDIGDRTQFGNQPEFADQNGETFVRLPLDTWNPHAPGERVFGTEIYSLESFTNEGGVQYVARARLTTEQPGLVAAFFTYSQRRERGRWVSDEIDFEVLSKQPFNRVLVTSWNDWGAPGSDYEDGIHHLGAFLDLPDYDWRQWNTYAVHWYPDRVEWYVNERRIRTHFSPVPDQNQPIRASLWAGGTTWPDAYDPSLAPVTTAAQNRRFTWDVDYIMVSRLGGGSGSQGPTPPTGLQASVSGGQVNLTWRDNADDETHFTVYRAWKPKGKADPDFSAIGQPDADATAWADSPPDGEHLYRVTASNADGESAPGNTVEVKVGDGKPGGKPRR